MKIYESTKLSNEEYHALEGVSGSTLAAIHKDCPAAWRFGERKETKALLEGTASHAAILEPDLFAKTYARGVNPEDHPAALVTSKDIQAWLKSVGVKGYTGKTKAELIGMVLVTGETPEILDMITEEHASAHEGKIILKHDVFDRLETMRDVIFKDEVYAAALGAGASFELSFIGDGVKARWDCVTESGEIWDYKTAVSAQPEEFAKKAHDLGYWLKMAFQADVYEKAFGEKPRRVVLLAQSKTAPFIPQAYELTDEQLEIGREQYEAAFRLLARCKESAVWPAYGGGVQLLDTPAWLANRYNF